MEIPRISNFQQSSILSLETEEVKVSLEERGKERGGWRSKGERIESAKETVPAAGF